MNKPTLVMRDGTEVELIKDEAVELHRELWGWLAENPGSDKDEWPGWGNYNEEWAGSISHCFACAYTRGRDCDKCLLVWPGVACYDNEVDDADGLFNRWDCSGCLDPEDTAELARQIRDLPVREEEE